MKRKTNAELELEIIGLRRQQNEIIQIMKLMESNMKLFLELR